jgi:Asp/Glu/hydantoin racemase
MNVAPRVALIHALAHSIAPVTGEFERAWPECRRMNLLDDSLSADLERSATGVDATMTARFLTLAAYAIATGAQGILFTCSAFGPCIDAVAARWPEIPVLKPNEAMIEEAVIAATAEGRNGRIGLVATFAATLRSMVPEFPAGVEVMPVFAEGALAALAAGDVAAHDRLAADAAREARIGGCSVIALAQFSLARAAPEVERAVALPVFTTPASAVRRLRERMASRRRRC